MDTELSYLAGYIDGDGCFYLGKNKRPIKYRSNLIISSTHLSILRHFKKIFGGKVIFGKKNKRFGSYAPINQWFLGINSSLQLTKKLLPFLKEKRIDAETFVEFTEEKISVNKDRLIEQIKISRKNDNLVTKEVVTSMNQISPLKEATLIDWAYIAGFIDAECCMTISRYKPTKGPNILYKAVLSCNNTKTPTIEWFLHTLGGNCSFIPRKAKNPKHRDQVRWYLSADRFREILPNLLPFLHHKQELAKTIQRFFDSIQKNGGDRQSSKFIDHYASILTTRESLVNHVRLLNLKGPNNI